MGFVVDAENRLVTVDHSHNNFCITTPQGNPAVITLGTLKVTSIFTRTKGKRDKRDPGDNSPMLYVLKGLHNLQTRKRDVGTLCASFRKILPAYLGGGFQWDWIVPLPSTSTVCSRFAERVFKHTQQGVCHPNALVKITAQQVLQDVGALRIPSRDKARASKSCRLSAVCALSDRLFPHPEIQTRRPRLQSFRPSLIMGQRWLVCA